MPPGSLALRPSAAQSDDETGPDQKTCAAPGEPDAGDFALLSRASAGDRAAWRALYLRHREFVFRAAYRFLGDEDAARDVTQDVFVALFSKARSYGGSARFTSLLWRVVANRCLNERARPQHQRRDDTVGAEGLALLPAPEETSPERILETRRREAAVRAAVLALPERQRLAVVLSRFEGLSYEQVAEALETSVSSVESLLFRARRTLAARLAPR